jgi:hypothetical protein
MNSFTKQGITYVLMIIPTLFALSVLVQGIQKIKKNDSDGKIAVGFGIFLLLLVVATYFLFIF